MCPATTQILSVAGLISVTVIWGLAFILVKWAVAEMDVSYFLFLRFLLASLTMALLFRRHLKVGDLKIVRSAFVLSIFLSGVYLSQTEGLRFTTATNSAMITGLYLVMIPIFSNIFFKSKTGIFSIIGALISLTGLYLLTQYSLTGFNYGDLLTIICALCCAWHIILTGRFTLRHKTIPLVIYQLIFTTVIIGATTLIKHTYTTHIPKIGWIALAVTALFSTCYAFIIQTAAQKNVDPVRVGIIFALEAVFGALFAWCLGGEVLTVIAFVGACLMVTGMLISEIHPVARYIADKIAG